MSKVTLNHLFASASGKLCKKEGTYVAYNKQTGKMYTAEYHEREDPNTAKQQAIKTTFTTKAKAASAWWNANKPLVDDEGNVTREATADYKKVMAKYKAQSKIGNPYSFLRTLVKADGTIDLGTTDTTSGGNTPAGGTSGGNSNPGGADIEA